MRFSYWRDPGTLTRKYTIEIKDCDILRMRRFDHLDTLLISECEGSESVSDKVLGLELLTRRIEEGMPA
jgi:hypothetical protein